MIWRNIIEAIVVARTKFPPAEEPNWDAFLSIAADSGDPADELARGALEAAVELIGQGEVGGNNLGPFVAMCVEPAKPPQNWCAGLAGFCYMRAAARLDIPMPFRRSLGAKRLGENVAAVGRKFTDPTLARPGDLMVFHRGAQGSWAGHVALVEEVAPANSSGVAIVYVIEGNNGPRVKRSARTTSKLDRFAFFASLRRG